MAIWGALTALHNAMQSAKRNSGRKRPKGFLRETMEAEFYLIFE